MKTFVILFSILFLSAANSLAGTVTVHTSTPAMFAGATGVFKCGELLDDNRYSTTARELSCEVVDNKSCTGFTRTSCKRVEYSYPQFAQWRASLLNKKVKYLGLAPVHTSGDDRMFVFVEEILQ